MPIRAAKRRRHPRRLFVTGGNGFLGRHVVTGPAAEPWEVIAPSSRALDLRNGDAVRSMIRDWRPTAVIHTAYRRNDRASIVDATKHVAEATERIGSRLVHVSSDAIFRGRMAPYTEIDEVHPIHDYGQAKRDAELIVLATAPSAAIVRTSLLYSESELCEYEIAARDAASGHSDMAFFTDEIRCPVLVEDLAVALVQLADRSDVTGILHLAGPRALSRSELAVLSCERHGWDATRLRFSTTQESGLRRPTRVVLDSSLAARRGLRVRGPF